MQLLHEQLKSVSLVNKPRRIKFTSRRAYTLRTSSTLAEMFSAFKRTREHLKLMLSKDKIAASLVDAMRAICAMCASSVITIFVAIPSKHHLAQQWLPSDLIYPLLTRISLVDACNINRIPESLHECAPALKVIQIFFPKSGHYTGSILYADWVDMNKPPNVPSIEIMIIPDVWLCFLLLFCSMQAMLHNGQGRPEYTQTITVQPYIPSQSKDRESALKYLEDVKEKDVRASQRKHRRVSPQLLFIVCRSRML
jgi:hypothetical protein